MNILLLDDSREHLDILQDILRTEHYSVLSSQNAFHALKVLSEHTVSCVILDLKMPVLEGQHVLTIIREKYPHIPIIILSGHIDNERELRDKGAYAVLAKPPHIETLLSTIQSALSETQKEISFTFTHTDLPTIKDAVIEQLVSVALKKSKGNQVKAALMLGISRQGLIRYMKRLSIPSHHA